MQSGKSSEKKLKNDRERETPCCSEARHGVVLTFGVFDGVHVAHRIVIRCVVNRAKALGIDGVVISFDPHPALSILGTAPPVLTTVAQKTELLEGLGINRVVISDFNEQFSRLSPEEFVRDVLFGSFHAREVVVGYDCAFGKDRTGDRWLLRELGEKYGFAVDVVEPYELEGDIVSSTRIRTAISQGELELAHGLLGRPYSISGPVVPGKGVGRRIGYATANLQLQNQSLPPSGVYAVEVRVGERRFHGILNMGEQPTFGGREFQVEVHLLDFSETLYGQSIEVFFAKKIRNEKVFASSEELVGQIKKDEVAARGILNAR
jgi:riboflavin kinase/FMN adenylyltransferase